MVHIKNKVTHDKMETSKKGERQDIKCLVLKGESTEKV